MTAAALAAAPCVSASSAGWPSAARPARRFFAAEAERLARLCHRMAERFARGGRLLARRRVAGGALGRAPRRRRVRPPGDRRQARAAGDRAGRRGRAARRASSTCSPSPTTSSSRSARPGRPRSRQALALARERGCLTVAFAPLGAEWEFEPPSDDPFVRQELVETLYHVLWELVHVFFEHRGLLEGRTERRVHDAGASSFLYPFLGEQEPDLEAVVADVRASVPMKAEEIGALREQTLSDGREALRAAAAGCAPLRRRRQAARARQRRLGDRRDGRRRRLPGPRRSGWPARRALDLTEDTAILTAIANDIGPEALFARQVIAYGRARRRRCWRSRRAAARPT